MEIITDSKIQFIRNQFNIINESDSEFIILKRGKVKTIPRYSNITGVTRRGNDYQQFDNTSWSKEETEWMWSKYRNDNLTRKELSLAMNRTVESINKKLARVGKLSNTYNEEYKHEKDIATTHYINHMMEHRGVKSVLDVYAGVDGYYKRAFPDTLNVTTNDKNKAFKTDHHFDALELMDYIAFHKKKYDIIDLDNFGSIAHVIEPAIRHAKKGLIVTLGEMGSRRWADINYVKRWWGINSMAEYTAKSIEEKIVLLGERYKKKITTVQRVPLGNIIRLYFTVDDMIVSTQKKHRGLDLTK